MKVLELSTEKYIPKCPECSEIIKFRINFNNLSCSIECKNGHNKNNYPYKKFQKNYMKSSQGYECYCSKCFHALNSESTNYKCDICNKLFCPNCLKEHSDEANHCSKKKFIFNYQLCPKHYQKFNSFCEDCKINLCEECLREIHNRFHENHKLKRASFSFSQPLFMLSFL